MLICTPRNLFVTFSYFFKKVVKILIDLKLEISFFLEVPLSSGETRAILASFGKTPCNRLLIMALNNGLHKTWAAILTELRGIMSMPTVFLASVSFKSFNISFEVVKQMSLPQGKHAIDDFCLIRVVLNDPKRIVLLILFLGQYQKYYHEKHVSAFFLMYFPHHLQTFIKFFR